MPTANFIEAMTRADRDPVVLISMESPDAQRFAVETQTDWQAFKSNSGFDLTSVPGSIIPLLAQSFDSVESFAGFSADVAPFSGTGTITPAVTQYVNTISGRVVLAVERQNFVDNLNKPRTWHVSLTINGVTSNTVSIAVEEDRRETYDGPGEGGFPQYIYVIIDRYLEFNFPEPFGTVNSATPYTVSINGTYDTNANTGVAVEYEYFETGAALLPVMDGTTVTATHQTKSLDLEATPGGNVTVDIDDIVPHPASVAYTARGSNDNVAFTDLGTVTDGASIAGYRYYDFTITATTNAVAGVSISSVGVTDEAASFDFYGTHADKPLPGVKPVLKNNPLSPLTSKIEFMKPVTAGEMTAKFNWTEDIDALIAAGGFKNKDVVVFYGEKQLAFADYEPIFTGTVYDYSGNWRERSITIKIRDIYKQWFKVKIPQETAPDGSGNRTVTPQVWTGVNIIQVMLDIMDLMNVRDRYIDRTEFEAIRDGVRSGADWLVTRTLNDPKQSTELLAELAMTARLFLVPVGNGKLTPYIYDTSAASVETIDGEVVEFGGISGELKEVATRQIIYYSPNVTDPGEDESEYDKVYLDIDATSETEFGEISERRWFDKWGATTNAITALANQMNDWFGDPRPRVKAEGIPPRFFDINPGQIITADRLFLPGGRLDGRKMLVTSRSFDTRDGTISWELYDTGVDTTAGAGVAGTDLSIAGLSEPYGSGNTYSVTGGTGPYSWTSSIGTLSASTGSEVDLDVTGVYSVGTISVTDSLGEEVQLRLVPLLTDQTITGLTAIDLGGGSYILVGGEPPYSFNMGAETAVTPTGCGDYVVTGPVGSGTGSGGSAFGAPGVYTFENGDSGCGGDVVVQDALGAETTITIPDASDPVLAGTSEPIVGSIYSATGGVAPYTFTVSDGTIDPDTGEILTLGTSVWTVTVTDACGRSDSFLVGTAPATIVFDVPTYSAPEGTSARSAYEASTAGDSVSTTAVSDAREFITGTLPQGAAVVRPPSGANQFTETSLALDLSPYRAFLADYNYEVGSNAFSATAATVPRDVPYIGAKFTGKTAPLREYWKSYTAQLPYAEWGEQGYGVFSDYWSGAGLSAGSDYIASGSDITVFLYFRRFDGSFNDGHLGRPQIILTKV